jgi:hypothetical protein
MTFSIRVLWGVVVLVAALALSITGWKWAQAASAERTQVQRLARLTTQANSINELRGKLPEWALAPKPPGTLAPEVSAILSASGLPASAMASLSADPDQGGTGNNQGIGAGNGGTGTVQARTRHATLVLGSVTLPQLGTFLQTWRDRQPAWTVATIDVTPELGSPAMAAKTQTGGDLPLRAVLTMENLSLQRSGGVR